MNTPPPIAELIQTMSATEHDDRASRGTLALTGERRRLVVEALVAAIARELNCARSRPRATVRPSDSADPLGRFRPCDTTHR